MKFSQFNLSMPIEQNNQTLLVNFTVFLAILLLSLFSCHNSNDETSLGNKIVVGSFPKLDLKTVSPLFSSSSFTTVFWKHVYGMLFQFDSKGAVLPCLVKSFSISEDLRVWDFSLHEGILCHDKSYLTAEDVVFTLNLYLVGSTGSYSLLPNDIITSIVETGKYSFRIFLNSPSKQLHHHLRIPVLPKKHFNNLENKSNIIKPIGFGQFEVQEIGPDIFLLKEFPQPFWGKSKFQFIETRFYRSENELWNHLIKKEIDCTILDNPYLIESLKDIPEINVREVRLPYFNLFGFNCSHFPFTSKVLRSSIYSILSSSELPENFRPRCLSPYYNFQQKRKSFENKKDMYKTILNNLQENGFTIRSNRMYHKKLPINFKILTCQEFNELTNLSLWIKENLRMLGLFPKIDSVALNDFDQRLIQHDFDTVICPLWAVKNRLHFPHLSKTALKIS